MAKNQSFDVELARLRAEIDAAKERLEWLSGAPLALVEAKQQASARVRAMAKNSLLPAKAAYFAHANYDAAGLLEDAGDLTTLLCALQPDIVEQRLHQLLEEHYRTLEAGPPLAERADRKLELEQVLFDLELAEERLICAWERDHGQVFPRRPDINPSAVLGDWEEAA